MKTIVRITIHLSALLLLCPACDSGGGGGGGGSITGLDSDLVIAEIPEAEQVAACEQLRDYSNDAVASDMRHMTCLGAALEMLMDSGRAPDPDAMKAPCQEAYDACLSEPAPLAASEPCDHDEECQASVGEVEACMKDQIAAVHTWVDNTVGPYSCSDLSGLFTYILENPDGIGDPEEPACVAELLEKGC